MEINEILEQFSKSSEDGPFPREALHEAVRQREAITPVLLDRLDWLLENVLERDEEIHEDPEYEQSWYALFLLAQFREKRAYPKYIRLLSLDSKRLQIAFGDEVCEAGRLLYSTYDGDLVSARALASDASLDPFARGTVLDLMRGLLRDGRMSRQELVDFIRERLNAIGSGEDEETFASLLADAAVSADLFELMEDFWEAYSQAKVDLSLLGDFDDFLDLLFAKTDPNHETQCLDDAIGELAKYASDENPSSPTIAEIKSWDVGRNDPCPCGSGKKFKKCCLKRLEEWELHLKQYEESMRNSYPPLTGQNGRPGLSDYFSQDAITVDRLAYRAVKLLDVPVFLSRAEEHRARRQAKTLLLEAFEELQSICFRHDLRTPEEYDREYHVHYDCAWWLEILLELLEKENPHRREVEMFLYD